MNNGYFQKYYCSCQLAKYFFTAPTLIIKSFALKPPTGLAIFRQKLSMCVFNINNVAPYTKSDLKSDIIFNSLPRRPLVILTHKVQLTCLFCVKVFKARLKSSRVHFLTILTPWRRSPASVRLAPCPSSPHAGICPTFAPKVPREPAEVKLGNSTISRISLPILVS